MTALYYRPFSTKLMGDNELPPHNALESLFPSQPPYVFDDIDVIRSSRRPLRLRRPTSDSSKEGNSILEHQIKEMNRYRMAVSGMGEDILRLREQVRDLEVTNTQLRRELNNYNYTTRLLTDSQEMDDLDKSELTQRYATLKNKMTKQTSDLKDYKDKVVKLQNELIKKNDAEKQYLEMSHAHQSQNELLLKLQTKVAKVTDLEAACKKQEKVIENLERIIKTKTAESHDKRANEAILDENKRLRAELHSLRDQQRQNQKAQESHQDILDMHQKLERSEARVRSLEKQLAENARHWAHDKTDLLLKLQESVYGLRRPSLLDYSYNMSPKLAASNDFSYPDVKKKQHRPSKLPTAYY